MVTQCPVSKDVLGIREIFFVCWKIVCDGKFFEKCFIQGTYAFSRNKDFAVLAATKEISCSEFS